MKYAFIQRHRHAWPVSVQCLVLQVSVASYHAHLVRRASDAHNDKAQRHTVQNFLAKKSRQFLRQRYKFDTVFEQR